MEIVTREEWGALPPKYVSYLSPLPTKDLILHHAGNRDVGASEVRRLQRYHMFSEDRLYSDIAYHYLIDGDGTIYEGRGGGVRGGATKYQNDTSHAIAFLGNHNDLQPTTGALGALDGLVRYGADFGWWPREITGGHKDFRPTSCPGSNLYVEIPNINQRLREEEEMTQEQLDAILAAIAGVPAANWKFPQKDDPTETSAYQYLIRTYSQAVDAAHLDDAELAEMIDALLDEQARRLSQ